MIHRTISKTQLAQLRAIVARKGTYARNLGVAVLEALEAERKLLTEDPKDLLLRLGAVRKEYLDHQAFYVARIATADAEQRAAGEVAMREAGVDPDAGEFTIDPLNGLVLQLLKGQWELIEYQETA